EPLHQLDRLKILGRDLCDRNIENIRLLLLDQIKKQVERPGKITDPDAQLVPSGRYDLGAFGIEIKRIMFLFFSHLGTKTLPQGLRTSHVSTQGPFRSVGRGQLCRLPRRSAVGSGSDPPPSPLSRRRPASHPKDRLRPHRVLALSGERRLSQPVWSESPR